MPTYSRGILIRMATEIKQAFIRLRSRDGLFWLAHPDLREHLIADADTAGTNLTEVASEILCRRYGVLFIPAGRRTAPRQGKEFLNLRIPWNLWAAISEQAAVNGRKPSAEIIHTLCGHYGLRVPAAPKRTRNRAPRAAAA